MVLIFEKVFSVLFIIAIGYILEKSGKLPKESCPYLTSLLLNVAAPCLSLYTLYEKELDSEVMLATLQTVIASVGYFIAAGVVAYIFVKILKVDKADLGCYVVMMVSYNGGFMGFPITKAIFGSDILYLLVINNVILTVYFYSAAIIQMDSGEKINVKEMGKALCNPMMFFILIGAIMLGTGYKPPETVDTIVRSLGDMTVPLSMLVVGLQLAKSDFKAAFKNKRLILASLAAMVLIPLFTFLGVNFLPLETDVKCVIIFATAFPSAVVPVALAEQRGKNAELMAQGVTITTFMSLITIPLYASLLLSFYY